MEGEESRDAFRVSSLLSLHQGEVKEEDMVWGRLKENRTDPENTDIICGTRVKET